MGGEQQTCEALRFWVRLTLGHRQETCPVEACRSGTEWPYSVEGCRGLRAAFVWPAYEKKGAYPSLQGLVRPKDSMRPLYPSALREVWGSAGGILGTLRMPAVLGTENFTVTRHKHYLL